MYIFLRLIDGFCFIKNLHISNTNKSNGIKRKFTNNTSYKFEYQADVFESYTNFECILIMLNANVSFLNHKNSLNKQISMIEPLLFKLRMQIFN